MNIVKALLFIMIFLCSTSILAQKVVVLAPNASEFPIITNKFFVFDENQNPVYDLSIDDFQVSEEGEIKNILSLTCPEPKPQVRLSVAMSFDISGSMRIIDEGPLTRLEIAKENGINLVDLLPVPPSEIAVQSANAKTYLIQDYTQDRNAINNKIFNLENFGYNDFYGHLMDPYSGLLPLAARGKFKRVAILYSDAYGGLDDVEYNKCLQYCLENEIVFYICVYTDPKIDISAHTFLIKLSEETGGKSYQGLLSVEEASEIPYLLLSDINVEPCELAWETNPRCERIVNDVVIEYKDFISDKSYYTIETELPSLNFDPKIAFFKDVPKGQTENVKVKVKANGAAFNVSNIESGLEAFSVTPDSFHLEQGEDIELTVSFTPTDSSYKTCIFQLINDMCQTRYYASAYYKKQSDEKTLEIIHPNGGEKLIVGSDTSISWKGISPAESVALFLSTDNGGRWFELIDSTDGPDYYWENVPDYPSDSCIVSAKQLNPETSFFYSHVQKSHTDRVNAVAWEPNKNFICTASRDNTIRIWNSENGELLDIINQGQGEILDLKWNSDMTYIASVGDSRDIILWDMDKRKIERTLVGHEDKVLCLEWSSKNNCLYSGGADGKVFVWDTDRMQAIREYDASFFGIRSLALSPDETKLACGGLDYRIYIYDTKLSRVTDTIKAHTDKIYSLAWSPDGKYLASGSGDKLVKLWDTNDYSLAKTFGGQTNEIMKLIWTNDSKQLCVQEFTSSIRFIDAETGEIKQILPNDYRCCDWSPGRDILIACSYERDNNNENRNILLWDVVNQMKTKEFTSVSSPINRVYWGLDSSRIVVGYRAPNYYSVQSLKLRDIKTGNMIKEFNTYVRSNPVNRQGDSYAQYEAKYPGWKLYINDILTGDNKNEYFTTQRISSFSWDYSGRKIAASWEPDSMKIWDIELDKEVVGIKSDNILLENLAFSPSGTFLAGSSLGNIYIYDIATGAPIDSLVNSEAEITCLLWDNFSEKIIAGYDNSEISVWDIANNRVLFSLSGHSGAINSVCISPDGLRIASCAHDLLIRVWDLNNGKQIDSLKGHTNTINYVSWGPYENIIASGSRDNSVMFWNLNNDKYIQTDKSDSVFTIYKPELSGIDVDMGELETGRLKDSLVNNFIINNDDYSIRVDSIAITGKNVSEFSIVSGLPPYILQPGESHTLEFSFRPFSPGSKSANIDVFTQSGTLKKKITGLAVDPKIELSSDLIDFGKVAIDKYKDTVKALIKNPGSADLVVESTKILGPDMDYFTIESGGGAFTLAPGEERTMTIRFAPNDFGVFNSSIGFEYKGSNDPAIAILIGEGVEKEYDCDETGFEYVNFSDPTNLKLLGDAKQKDTEIRLTSTWEQQAGAMWHNRFVPIRNGFVTKFKFRVSEGQNRGGNDKSYPGADGLAFVIQNSGLSEIGSKGGGIGYSAIPNALAVEFDLFANDENQIENLLDPNGNHIAVQSGGKKPINSVHNEEYMLGITDSIIEIQSIGQVYNAKIEYIRDNKQLKVYFDTLEVLAYPNIVVENLELDKLLELEDGEAAYVGLTSATGNAVENHDILYWYFCPEQSDFVKVEEAKDYDIPFSVYPNPAKDELTIVGPNIVASDLSIHMRDIFGREIALPIKNYAAKFSVNISHLPTGSYFVKIIDGNEIFTKKIEIIR